MTIEQLAGQLASFSVFPPVENVRPNRCAVDRLMVGPGSGVVVIGHDEGGTFAVTLHRDCAAKIKQLKEGTCPSA